MPEEFNIVSLFYEAAVKSPDKTAIIYRKQKISFADFEKQVTATANYFISMGLKKGDRVLIFVPMSISLYRIVLALFRIGAVAVFLDEWVSKKRLDICCQVAQCQAFIGNLKATLLSFFSTELRKIPIKLSPHRTKMERNSIFPVTYSYDTALITFTTGSTGIPKAAKRTHGFLLEQFNALRQKIKPMPNEVDMPVLPIVLLINLGAGITSVIADYKANKPAQMRPKKIIEQLQQNKVNRVIASPFFIKEIAKYISEHGLQLPLLKKILTGGAPVFPAEAALYAKAFPDATTEIVYGSTEAEPISAISVKELIKETNFLKGLNVGKVDPCAEVKIIQLKDEPIFVSTDKKLTQLEMPLGEIGEIIVSGKHVLREYINNEIAIQRNQIISGEVCWHRTGDSGYFDEKGNLRLTGRCSSLLYANGNIIAPFMYENYFQTIKGIEMGTILMHKEKIVAIIELMPGIKKEQVNDLISNLALPFDSVNYIKKIPRDPRHNSKIDYQKLAVIISA